MDVLVTCKYKEDPIKNEGARVDTTLYSNFSDTQGQITLVLVSVSGRNLNSSKLSCMSSLPLGYTPHNIHEIWLLLLLEEHLLYIRAKMTSFVNSLD